MCFEQWQIVILGFQVLIAVVIAYFAWRMYSLHRLMRADTRRQIEPRVEVSIPNTHLLANTEAALHIPVTVHNRGSEEALARVYLEFIVAGKKMDLGSKKSAYEGEEEWLVEPHGTPSGHIDLGTLLRKQNYISQTLKDGWVRYKDGDFLSVLLWVTWTDRDGGGCDVQGRPYRSFVKKWHFDFGRYEWVYDVAGGTPQSASET